jgi:pimeloyl-ACP methyl ester carboxylesterase/DNA-binding CsgD family transcriptional regulator
MVRAAHWLSHINHETQCPLWAPWLSLFARRHKLTRYDGRGCGLSDRAVEDFSLDRCVEDLEAVVENVKIDRFVLTGATIGAITALAYAARHPERVSHLVLVGGFAVGRSVRNPPDRTEEAALEFKAIELGWGHDNPAYRQFVTSMLVPDATPQQARSLNELMRLATSPDVAVKRLRPFHSVDLSEIATRIRCPTLIFHSRADARIPFEQGRALAALIPGARFVALDSRNHWVVDTERAWAQFVGEFENFLPDVPRVHDLRNGAALATLTKREMQILDLLAAGLDNVTIGRRLGISEKTVRNGVSIIFSKLAVSGRSQAIVRAREAGFGLDQQGG